MRKIERKKLLPVFDIHRLVEKYKSHDVSIAASFEVLEVVKSCLADSKCQKLFSMYFSPSDCSKKLLNIVFCFLLKYGTEI